ncbi:STY4528 family pathogenicity island replication protein, partial [Pseudomonas parafulva]|uniref:STY4528 family pathogenicity island replication protein n=1 Tax=Pseudomonas parafulva TaxID=157782 RepID=UPI001E64537A
MTIPQTPAHTHNTKFATPTALMLDARLTPLERNGWQMLRMLRAPDGISSLASLGQLRRYLTSIPLGQKAGHETTWRVLVVLRLTGWISLAGQQRDPLTGHVLSEQYQVHDHSHHFAQACALAPTLPQLLRQGCAPNYGFDAAGGTIGSHCTDWLLSDNRERIHPVHCEIVLDEGLFCVVDRSGH